MPATLNTPRSEALRAAPLDSWVALSEDESRIVATGDSYARVAETAEKSGVADPIIIKTPKEWLPLSV